MKQAKIQLSADIKGFSQKIEEAKKQLKTIDSLRLEGGFAKTLKDKVSSDLKEMASNVERQIKFVEGRLDDMSKNMGKGFDANRAMRYVQVLDRLKKKYEEISKAAKEAADNGSAVGAGSGAGPAAGGGGGGGLLSKIGGRLGGRLLGAAIGTMGVTAALSRRMQMATERLDVRAVTGGADLETERSGYGYTPSERRQRAAQLARASRRNMSAGEITGATNLSEQLSRAYGIDIGTQTGAVGVARTMGEQNAQKALMDSFSSAVRAGMEGSNIERYMQAQTAYLEEMSTSVNIDRGSLDGFAESLGDIPFFKNDPNRIFDAIRGIGDAFQRGDRFQQGQAMRAISRLAPGAGPAELELRRSMGLFANTKSLRGALSGLEGQAGFEQLNAAFGAGGGDIINQMGQEAVAATEGMNLGPRMQSIMERLGLQGEGGVNIAAKLIKGQKISDKEVDMARLSPEEQIKQRLNQQVYTGVEKSIKDLETLWEAMKDAMAENIANPIAKLTTRIEELIKALGGDAADLGGDIGAAGAIAAGAAGLGAGALIKKGAGAIMRGGSKAAGAIGRGAGAAARGAGALGRGAAAIGSRALPFLGPTAAVAGAGYLGWEAGSLIEPWASSIGTEENKYGQKSGALERGVGKVASWLPEWAGGISDKQYQEMYGEKKATGDSASSDMNTAATVANTAATLQLVEVMSRRGPGASMGGPSYMRPVGHVTMGKGR